MSYLALARKYRPRTFADVLGQEPVVRALSHALAGDKLHPAILLTGTRGVGKTTLARIVAKGLNCEEGVRDEGCGKCGSCREVDEGRFVDLLEIDAASNTGVDNVRELIDNAQYPAVRGRYKVYLVDEVHMLSKSAFNALLKTLEEPPPHVKFILATTDPQKLPVTVLSRCLQFNLRRLPPALIRERLDAVLADEGVAFEPEATIEVARAADGSMRDGLSLLDQAIAFSGGQPLTREGMEEMIGTIGRRDLFGILESVHDDDRPALAGKLEALAERAPDYAALLGMLGGYLQRIAVVQLLAIDDAEDEPEVAELAGRIDPEDVQLYYQISVTGRRDLPWAPDPRAGFEMAIMRMLAFRPGLGESAARGAPRTASTPAAGTKSKAEADEPGGAGGKGEASWSAIVEALELDALPRQLARHCELVSRRRGRWQLRLDASVAHLLNDERRAEVEQALSVFERGPVQLLIDAGQVQQKTPSVLAAEAREQRQRDAEEAMQRDPVVRALIEELDAELIPGSIRVIDKPKSA